MKERGAADMVAPLVILMLNSVDFIAEDDYIADDGEPNKCRRPCTA